MQRLISTDCERKFRRRNTIAKLIQKYQTRKEGAHLKLVVESPPLPESGERLPILSISDSRESLKLETPDCSVWADLDHYCPCELPMFEISESLISILLVGDFDMFGKNC